jgi:DNA polymerase
MSEKDQNLYDEILRFLEYEREVYGPFVIPESQPGRTGDKPGKAVKPSPESKTSDPYPSSKQDQESVVIEEPESLSLEQRLQSCSSLDELELLCKQTEELRTDLPDTNLVFGVGNPKANLMLIGEAPGAEEDRQGEPFVGPAGQLLNKILKAINFDRDDVYIANILKHRPPGNRNPNPDERLRSLPYLIRQIELISPNIILCLGRVSATTLLKKEDSLRNLRGSFYPFHGAELTVTYHPAALLRNPQWKRPTWEDVQMVRTRYDELSG